MSLHVWTSCLMLTDSIYQPSLQVNIMYLHYTVFSTVISGKYSISHRFCTSNFHEFALNELLQIQFFYHSLHSKTIINYTLILYVQFYYLSQLVAYLCLFQLWSNLLKRPSGYTLHTPTRHYKRTLDMAGVPSLLVYQYLTLHMKSSVLCVCKSLPVSVSTYI